MPGGTLMTQMNRSSLIKAFRPDARMVFDAPYTPDKVLMSLYA
jgi:hypothetical protein